MEDKSGFPTLSMREAPFWRDGMTPEEYEKEQAHLWEMASKKQMDRYEPLWKLEEKEKKA